MDLCTCGRNYIHCKVCGKKNPYPKMKASMEASLELGQRVTVRRCQTCGNETHDLTTCTAPPFHNSAEYVAESTPIKVKKTNETDSFVDLFLPGVEPGSNEYVEALSKRYNELAGTMKFKST